MSNPDTNPDMESTPKKLSALDEAIAKAREAKQQELPLNDNTVTKALKHITTLKDYALGYAGKVGYNPYLWLKEKNLHALELSLRLETTPLLEKAAIAKTILEIQPEPPVIQPVKSRTIRDLIKEQPDAKKAMDDKIRKRM